MEFLRKFVVIGGDGGERRVFAYFSEKQDALDYVAKAKKYNHVEAFERITENGEPIKSNETIQPTAG